MTPEERLQHYTSTNWVMKSKRGRLSPLPNVYSMEAVTSLTRDFLGISWDKILLTFQERDMTVFIDEPSFAKAEQEGLAYLEKDLGIFSRRAQEIKEIAPKWISWLQDLKKQDLSTKANSELASIYLQYRDFYKQIYGRYFTIIILENMLVKKLESVLAAKMPQGQVSSVLTTLTTEYRAMHTKHEMRDRLQTVSQIVQNKEWRAFWEQDAETVLAVLDSHESASLVDTHQKNYFWVTRDYEDAALTKADVITRFKEVLDAAAPQRAAAAQGEEARITAAIEALENSHGLSNDERALFAAMRDGVYIKELRKKLVSQSLEYFDHVMEEIGVRIGTDLRLARMLVSEDIQPALIEKQPYKEILENRYKQSVYVADNGTLHTFVGNSAEKIVEHVIKIDTNVKELPGLSGAAGVARGPARIVKDPADFDKVQQGDIMITVQAVPSFMKTLLKCKGLVADGGTGITSHPATLAREANVPCVFQAKIATQVLKDGQMIEVDGDNGIVRILEVAEGESDDNNK